MSCLYIKTGDIKRKTFLTREEKLVFLYRLFLRERAKHKSAVFIPSDRFYAAGTVDDQHLSAMGREIIAWLGIKHHNLSIRFSTDESPWPAYMHDKVKPVLLIPYHAYDRPYYCAALLTHGLMHYFLTSRHHLTLTDDQNEEFTDLACVSAGLGIVLLNGFIPNKSGIDRILHHRHFTLPGMNLPELSAEIKHFLVNNPVPRDHWIATALPATRTALQVPDRSPPLSPYVRQELQKLRKSRQKTALIMGGLLMLVGLNLAAIAASPRNLPPEQLARKEKIEVLKQSYNTCIASVTEKRQRMNQDDIFMLRIIQKDELTCKSLMNKHNYEVDQYNKYWKAD